MELISGKPLKPIWLKASVTGSVWASLEIIFGSFLHNLRVPFSGMLMSLVSVWIIIAFLQIWKDDGLIWRAGLICALMKSISPSAVILGPMMGIITEAFLIEFAMMLFGKNLIAYSIGGALAVTSTLAQKIISLLITYGLDLIKIADGLYKFVVKQIGLAELSLISLLIIIIALYSAIGLTGAILGYNSGKNYLKKNSPGNLKNKINLKSTSNPFKEASKQDYSVILLIVNLLTIAGILVLFNSDYVIAAIIASILYFTFCTLQYRNSLKRLKKFSFWITFLLITFVATFLWEGVSKGVFFSSEGLITGVKMNVRAVIMAIGFASISVELKNPLVKSILYNRGFANLYQSLNLSFAALPYIISTISSKEKKNLSESVKQSHGIFHQAEELYELFVKEDHLRPEVVVITGAVHKGKTTYAQTIIKRLQEKHIRVGGFLALAANSDNERSGFTLKNIETSGEIELCNDVQDKKKPVFGKYYFNPDALHEGRKLLSTDNLTGKQVVVIDEIGPLELKGEGWSSSIDEACLVPGIIHIWIIRKGKVEDVLRKWNVRKAIIFDIENDTEDEAVKCIEDLLSERSVQS